MCQQHEYVLFGRVGGNAAARHRATDDVRQYRRHGGRGGGGGGIPETSIFPRFSYTSCERALTCVVGPESGSARLP